MTNKIQYWKVGEVATRFRVSRAAVYKWIESGEIAAMRLGKGNYRITEDDVQRFERRSRV